MITLKGDLENQESIKRMLTSISQRRGGVVSESTKTTFLIYIKRFCEFCDMTPDNLIADRMKDWKSDDIFTRRRHEEKLMEFAKYLRKEDYKSNTVSTAIGAVRSFYRTNYLPMTEVNIPSGRPVRKYKIPTKEELNQAIASVNVPWHGAFMTLTKDCGISLQDMLSLKMGDGSPIYGSINQQLREDHVPIHLQIVREKTQFTYDTFLGEDSFEVLNEEDIFPRITSKSVPGDTRLFPYSDSTIQDAMKVIGEELDWKHFTPYSLRKYFRTQLTLDDMNEALIESMMGHSLAKVKSAYLVPPTQGFIEIYKKHYDALKL
jgi:integrase